MISDFGENRENSRRLKEGMILNILRNISDSGSKTSNPLCLLLINISKYYMYFSQIWWIIRCR